MLKKFIDLFKSDITVINIKNTKKDSAILKNIVKIYSEGNVNLQQGKYITEDIIKAKQKEIFSYKFSL